MLKFNKSQTDVRGTILFCSFGKFAINIVETKKGFSRGGHFHEFDSEHFLIKGKIEFRELDLNTNTEKIRILSAPHAIPVKSKIVHLLTALDDSIFLEYFDTDYSATEYSPYREVVNQKINQG